MKTFANKATIITLLCATSASVIYYYAYLLPAQSRQQEKLVTLELQEKCAKQAQEQRRLDDLVAKKESADLHIPNNSFDLMYSIYENHYNEKLNKCFIHGEFMPSASAGSTTLAYLVDGFESKEYGSYWGKNDAPNLNDKSMTCKVILPSGEEQKCQSLEEFDELIKKYYMQ